MSQARCRQLLEQFGEWDAPRFDHDKPIERVLTTFNLLVHEAWKTFEATTPGSGDRVKAMKAISEFELQRFQIERQTGRAPRSLGAPAVEARQQVLMLRLMEITERNVPDERLDEVMAQMHAVTAEMRSGSGVVDARPVPPAE